MALFHFTADQIKRSEGQSVMASAAYRSGEKLHSAYYGEDSDYTRFMLCAGSADLPLPMNALIKSCSGWKATMIRERTKANMPPERHIRSVISRPARIGMNGKQMC